MDTICVWYTCFFLRVIKFLHPVMPFVCFYSMGTSPWLLIVWSVFLRPPALVRIMFRFAVRRHIVLPEFGLSVIPDHVGMRHLLRGWRLADDGMPADRGPRRRLP